jgi:hypothetical protein
VIKFSAGGFRDFTRIAASDPVMWRDVFLNNKEAVLEMLARFSEDLTACSAPSASATATRSTSCSWRRVPSAVVSSKRSGTAAPDFGRQHGSRCDGCLRHAGQEALGLMSATHHDLWVFGYGSLMWRPGLPSRRRGVRA